jgi:hypothetical protein
VRAPGRIGLVVAGALFAFAAWQLFSATWSESPWRAAGEVDRTVLYLLVFLTFATLPRQQLQPMLLSVGLGIAVIAIVGLATRLRPDLFPIQQTAFSQRLSYPLTYWNAVALMVALGMVIALQACADFATSRPVRVIAAGLFPALGAALFLTLSRGGIAAAVFALALFAVLGRPRGLILALVAIAVPTWLAVSHAYDATALVGADPTGPAAIAQGRALENQLFLWCGCAAAIRAALIPFDRRLARLSLPSLPPRARVATIAVIVAVAALAAVASGLTGAVDRRYHEFVQGTPAQAQPLSASRDRLTRANDSQRLNHWRVALRASSDHRLTGLGAATFGLQWLRYRDNGFLTTEAHSLYVETLSELGVVGLVMLLIAIGALIAAPFTRFKRRPAAAAAAAVVAAWALHSGVDWDWEMPAVSIVPLLLAAVAATVPARPSGGRRRLTPWIAGVGAMLLIVVPAASALAGSRLDQALSAYKGGDCASAVVDARAAASIEHLRPEPHALLAVCALRSNDLAGARSEASRAISLDRQNWEWRYLDALIAGASGGDPRPPLRDASRLNEQGVQPRALAGVYGETPRALWPLRSVQAYVWIGGRAYPALRR